MFEELIGPERRRRRSPQEKIAIVQETLQPGMTVSHVARLHGVNANQIFAWRKQYQETVTHTAAIRPSSIPPPQKLTAGSEDVPVWPWCAHQRRVPPQFCVSCHRRKTTSADGI